MKEFVFWQGILSIHQSALLRNLAASYGAKVTLIVWEELDAGRRATGWYKPDFGQTRIIVKPTSKAQSELLSGDLSNSVYIFSGTRGHPMVWNAFCQSLSLSAYIGIQSEAYDGRRLKGLLRLLRSKYDALRFRERVNFILGIGSKGVDWFKKSGYLQDRIFPFGYFVETSLFQNTRSDQKVLSDKSFDLIFVGRPLFDKGLDILLHALHDINSLGWYLHIVGDGDDKDKFVKLCARLGLADSVHFHGTLPSLEVINLIGKSDLLVLPSRWDGWGAVVNEALMCGVPVVCSDKCGAADLLDGHERGEVFSSDSTLALRSVLCRWISQGRKDAARSEKIRAWSKCINGESAADYFLAVVDASITGGKQPIPPWFK
jgi:glycosyltransferase involved in cell wall biosynthesis